MIEKKLQDDFPVDWEEDNYVSRREFLKYLTLGSGLLAAGSAAVAVWSTIPRSERQFETVKIAEADAVRPNGFILFSYPRKEDLCMLIRLGDGQYVAYSRRCTHLSCPVEYQPKEQRLYCPCHNGAFSASDGKVLQGPPPRPLPQIVLDVRSDGIYATGVKLVKEA